MSTTPGPQFNAQQQQLITKLNDTLDNITCDANCQQKQAENNANQKYSSAYQSHATSFHALQEAKKDLCIKKYGEQECAQKMMKENRKIGGEIAGQLKTLFDKEFDLTYSMLDAYESLVLNTKNTRELNEIVEERTVAITDKLYTSVGETETDDRKSTYAWQTTTNMKRRYSIMFYFFYVLLIALSVRILYNPPYSIPSIIIIILLALYPFIVHPIYEFIMKIINTILWFFYWIFY